MNMSCVNKISLSVKFKNFIGPSRLFYTAYEQYTKYSVANQ